jgi:5-methylcytosine-specific restriction endonuclease McrA
MAPCAHCGHRFLPRLELPLQVRRFCCRDCYYDSQKVPLQRIYTRDAGICHLCGRRVPRAEASRDHLRPVSRGGRTVWVNIRLAHRSCNSVRGNLPLTIYFAGRRMLRRSRSSATLRG